MYVFDGFAHFQLTVFHVRSEDEAENTQYADDDEEGDEIDLSSVDPFDLSFDPLSVYDNDTVTYLQAQFRNLSDDSRTLSFDQLLKWEEMERPLRDGDIDAPEMKLLWDDVPKVDQPGLVRMNDRSILE
jgi:endonuclease YncB( thermonuclease family)